MSEQTYPEGWVLAWHRLPSSPMKCWQHQNGRLSGTPDGYVDWREEGWYADPRMEPQPDKPEPPIENGWWMMSRKDNPLMVAAWERRDGGWWRVDGSQCSGYGVELYAPTLRLTDEQATTLREQTVGEQ